MPLYLVGGAGSGSVGQGTPDHQHHPWETPDPQEGGNQVFKVLKGKYKPGHLEVGLSAAIDGELGFTMLCSPLNFQETSPSEGVFTLSQEMPDGWLIRARYIK